MTSAAEYAVLFGMKTQNSFLVYALIHPSISGASLHEDLIQYQR